MKSSFHIEREERSQGGSKVLVLRVTGTVSTETAEEVERACSEALGRDGTPVVLDFGGVEYITSGGLRALLNVRRTALDAGKTMKLAAIRRELRENVFDALGFSNLFDICGSVDEAVTAIGREGA